jgi:putative transposase
VLHLNLGDLVEWEGAEYVVSAATDSATLLYRIVDGTRVWVDVATLGAAGDMSLRPKVLHVASSAASHGVLPTALSEDERDQALWWEEHINEVIHGVPYPADTTLRPRPGYENPSKTARRELKVHELQAAGVRISVRTLGRKEGLYRKNGLAGLLDQRQNNSRPIEVDPRVVEAVLAVLEDSKSQSTVAVTTLINKVRAYVATRYRGDEGLVVPSNSTIRRLIETYDDRGLARGKATARRSADKRPDRPHTPIVATAPGAVVEIDSTPVNVLCLMPDGKVGRPHLTVAMDVATRSILGFSMVPTGASGVEHADLLARILRPRRCRPDAPDWMRLDASSVLPHDAMVAIDARQRGAIAVPYIVPETITTDRGKDYLSPTFVAACQHFGISVRQAPPQSPTFKGHIERLMGSIDTLWMQVQPGYIGIDPTHRGTISNDGLLTLRELSDLFEQWWVRVWQNRPNDALRDRDVPSRRFTPNQMYAAMFDASAGIPVPIDESTYISLMPVHRRVLQPGGFRLNNLTYWADELTSLMKAKPGTKDGKWEVRCDPYDPDRVWVAHPETGEWIECISESFRLDVYPFASALRKLRGPAGDAPAEDAQQEWATEVLAAQPTALSKKRAARKAAVKQRREADQEPRPAPIRAPEPPRPAPAGVDPDEFRLVSPDEELWSAT